MVEVTKNIIITQAIPGPRKCKDTDVIKIEKMVLHQIGCRFSFSIIFPRSVFSHLLVCSITCVVITNLNNFYERFISDSYSTILYFPGSCFHLTFTMVRHLIWPNQFSSFRCIWQQTQKHKVVQTKEWHFS